MHRLRGRASNRKIAGRVTRQALRLLARPCYASFGPTLAAEHLARTGILVSRETLRGWMTGAGLWRPRRQKVAAVHVWRERRAAFGELVLLDTSEHAWLEERGPKLCLIALIDDATSQLWARARHHRGEPAHPGGLVAPLPPPLCVDSGRQVPPGTGSYFGQ